MNKSIQFAAGYTTFLIAAASTQANDHAAPQFDPQTQIRGVIASIQQGNARYSKGHSAKYFQTFADKQSPRATVVTCADSRVHENDFTLRRITIYSWFAILATRLPLQKALSNMGCGICTLRC